MSDASGSAWRRLKRDHAAMTGAAVLLLMFAAVPFAGLLERLMGVSGVDVDLLSRFAPPSRLHPLGADIAGRDELARLLRGGQTSLTIGLLGALGTGAIGTVVGGISGYLRGRIDMLLMRITDFVIAVPHLPILVILAALDLEKLGFDPAFVRSGAAAYWRVLAIVTLFGWTGVARLVRAGTMALAAREFVEAARVRGIRAADRVRPHFAEHAYSGDRAHYNRHGARDPDRIRPFLPGARDSIARDELGQHVKRRTDDDRGRPVAGHLAGGPDILDCRRHQLSRRWAASRFGTAQSPSSSVNLDVLTSSKSVTKLIAGKFCGSTKLAGERTRCAGGVRS